MGYSEYSHGYTEYSNFARRACACFVGLQGGVAWRGREKSCGLHAARPRVDAATPLGSRGGNHRQVY